MTHSSLHFILPGHLKADKFISQITENNDIRLISETYSLKTYYDSFDWRLFSAHIICELNQSKSGSNLVLTDIKKNQVLASVATGSVPGFVTEITQPQLKKIISPLLQMRALQPITTLDYTVFKFNGVNKDEKTVFKITFEAYPSIKSRVQLEPIKGYDKALKIWVKKLLSMGLIEATHPVLVDALKIQGRKPSDYSSKLSIELAPDMRADIAVKYIFSHLLKAIKINEQGTLADIDSEFLHDFRVAVRRTRSGLSQLKGVLPGQETAKYKHYFAWLGQITNQTRDLDVYLLKFPDYKSTLPVGLREDLNPLYGFLQHKQKRAQKTLAKKLKSTDYISPLIAWEALLTSAAVKKPIEHSALIPIKQLADKRILKVYKYIIRDGEKITDQSPASALHELRKTCKKLRYLMEFFQSLYPDKKIKPLIKSLKNFQEILGDFQDLEIQELALKQFSEEMMKNNIPANTFLAMGVLIQQLDKRRQQARRAFGARFQEFEKPENQKAFHTLFKN